MKSSLYIQMPFHINYFLLSVTCENIPAIATVKKSECDFENVFCGWTRGVGSTFNFKRTQGATDEGNKTGPSGDRNGSVKGAHCKL